MIHPSKGESEVAMENSKQLSEQNEKDIGDLILDTKNEESSEVELFIQKMKLQNQVLKQLSESLKAPDVHQIKKG
jgi:hypothetical protein